MCSFTGVGLPWPLRSPAFLGRLTRKEVALRCAGEEEVGSESGGESQERAGAGKGVIGPVSEGEEAGEEG